MSLLAIPDYKKKKLFNNSRKVLEAFHVKLPIYNFSITLAQDQALHRLRKLADKGMPEPKKPTGKKIIFHNLHGTYLEAIYKEASLAKPLQLRGHDVKMLLCAGALTSCCGLFTNKVPPNQWMCRNCNYFSQQFFDIIKLPYATYFDYIAPEQISAIKEHVASLSLEEGKNLKYKKVNVGFHAITSAQRFYKGGDPTKSKYSYETVFRTRLANAMISTDVAEQIIKKEKPDVMVTSHSCYASWGSFADYFRYHDVQTYTWYTGYRPDSLIFDLDKIDNNYNDYYNTVRKKKPLTKAEENELNSFLTKRTTGEKGGGETYFYGFTHKGEQELEDQFHFSTYKKTCGIFPNLPWDVDLTYTNLVFNDVLDWVRHTIKLFYDKPEYKLIVKIHPAELLFQSEKTVLDEIKQQFPDLPKNISVIPPDTKISPYSLFPFLDCGIIYNGTLGLEMLMSNIPIVVAGEAHYRDKGFTYDASDKNDYRNLLLGDTKLKLTAEQYNIAKVYAYYYFIKSFIPFDVLYYKNYLNHGWKIKSFEEFAEGKNKYIDHISNYIVNGGVFQTW